MRKRHSVPQTAAKNRTNAPKSKGKRPFSVDLVNWYRSLHRKLPWRAAPEVCQDPYRTWLSEIMLQQTTVVTVIPYYRKFLTRWPDVYSLARAELDEVLKEWAGLGYYARARNLHACARAVVKQYDGKFPQTVHELLNLPGVGPYTAAAVGAMAFGLRCVPVDGNVERVMARLYVLKEPPIQIKKQIKEYAQAGLDSGPDLFSGDYAQALMDLGATVCTPKSPKCAVCPLSKHCRAFQSGKQEKYPISLPKRPKPHRCGGVFIITDVRKTKILIEKRPDRGLLAGMMAFPTTDWIEMNPGKKEISFKTGKLEHIGRVRHSFTHFDLELDVYSGNSLPFPENDNMWRIPLTQIPETGLPKVFLKAFHLYRDEVAKRKEKDRK